MTRLIDAGHTLHRCVAGIIFLYKIFIFKYLYDIYIIKKKKIKDKKINKNFVLKLRIDIKKIKVRLVLQKHTYFFIGLIRI